MAKRYYKVRAVNPGPPPPRARASNPSSRARNPGRPRDGATKKTGNYKIRYEEGDWVGLIEIIPIDRYGGQTQTVVLHYDLDDDADLAAVEDDWFNLGPGDNDVAEFLLRRGYDEYGKPLRANPRRRNVAQGGITIEEQAVLEDLAREARDSEDDWGIQQGVRDYLGEAYANRADDTPAQFLKGLQQDVWWHYGHSGEGTEAEGADPMFSKESAKRAEASIGRAIRKLPKRQSNPRFRYAAVPVDDDGTETAHVVRGRRRADMVRAVARDVPPDAMVDLGRTRTFATKHEAVRYAEKTSPRVRTVSRRISDAGR